MQSVATLLSPQLWAQDTFGEVKLGDPRRRALDLAEALARDPAATFPQQMSRQADLQATYRFLDSAHVSYEDLLRLCWQHTRQAAEPSCPTVLLLQDATEYDHAKQHTMSGLGAVEPDTRCVLGLLHQEAFLREPAPFGETSRSALRACGRPRLGPVSFALAHEARWALISPFAPVRIAASICGSPRTVRRQLAAVIIEPPSGKQSAISLRGSVAKRFKLIKMLSVIVVVIHFIE